MRRFFLALWVPCLVASCTSNPTGPTVEPASEFVLAPGQRVTVTGTGLTIRFERVVSDSRCPADALCITAGDAEVAITVRGGDRPADALSLSTASKRNRVELGEWVLSLTELAPYPFTRHAITPAEYRVTLRVDPLA